MRAFLTGETIFNYRDLAWPSNETVLADFAAGFKLDLTRRALYLGPFFAIANTLGLTSLMTEKIFFVIIGFAMGFLPFISSFKFLRSKLGNDNQKKIFVVSLVFGLFYMLNPYAVQKLSTTAFGFAFSYSLIPLVFYFYDKSLNERKFSSIFYAGLVISLAIAGTMQFLIHLPLFLLIPWLILTVIRKRKLKQESLLALRNAFFVFGIWFLISSYWLFMTAAIFATNTIPHPSYVLTTLMLGQFSEATNLTDVFRLGGVWWPLINITPIVGEPFWTFLTFVPPIFAISSILLTRKRELQFYQLSFSVIMLFIMFFYKGTQPPLPDVYGHLYDLPIVGWMFRVPDTNGMFVPLYMGLMIAIGLYHVLSLNTRKIINPLKFAVPAFLVVSMSIVAWPMFTGDYGGAYKEKPPSEPSIIKDDAPNPFEISKQNVMVIGGNDKLRALDASLPNGTAIIPADLSLGLVRSLDSSIIDKLVLDNRDELPMRFLDSKDAIVISPFDHTRNHRPPQVWSVASTQDPLHADFHPYLNQFKLKNEDIDFSKGVVITWGNDTLKIPFQISKSGPYVVYIRYLENQQGGNLGIDIDGTRMYLYTKERTDSFLWKDVGTYDLKSGEHMLSLANLDGLNAVNIVALIPASALSKMTEAAQNFAEDKRLIYDLDSKSNFYMTGREIQSGIDFRSNGTFQTVISNQIRVPDNASALALEFRSIQNNTSPSSYKIKDLSVTPVFDKYLLDSDFENDGEKTLWKTSNSDFLSISIEKERPISGIGSLRIDVKNAVNANPNWKTVESSLIPTFGGTALKIQVTTSAENTNSAHSKIRFFDKDRKYIGDALLFNIINTPNRGWNAQLVTPIDARFVSLSFWTKPSQSPGFLLLDNARIENMIPQTIYHGDLRTLKNLTPMYQDIKLQQSDALVSIKPGEQGAMATASISPIAVTPNMILKYSMLVDADHVDEFSVRSIFSNNRVDSPVYYNDTLGNISTIRSGQSLMTSVNILKESDYTIAVSVRPHSDHSSLETRIGEQSLSYLLNDNDREFRWIYQTIHLPKGITGLSFMTQDDLDIGRVVMFSDSREGEKLPDLYATEEKPGNIRDFKKLSDTDYSLMIESSSPIMLKFDKIYSGLWAIHYGDKRAYSIPLYPSMSGFIVDAQGNIGASVEYLPQHGLFLGMMITIATIALSVIFLVCKFEIINSARMALPIRLLVGGHSNLAASSRQLSTIEDNVSLQKENELHKLLNINNYKLAFLIALVLLISLTIFMSQGQKHLDNITIPLFLILSIGTAWGFIELKVSKKRE